MFLPKKLLHPTIFRLIWNQRYKGKRNRGICLNQSITWPTTCPPPLSLPIVVFILWCYTGETLNMLGITRQGLWVAGAHFLKTTTNPASWDSICNYSSPDILFSALTHNHQKTQPCFLMLLRGLKKLFSWTQWRLSTHFVGKQLVPEVPAPRPGLQHGPHQLPLLPPVGLPFS